MISSTAHNDRVSSSSIKLSPKSPSATSYTCQTLSEMPAVALERFKIWKGNEIRR